MTLLRRRIKQSRSTFTCHARQAEWPDFSEKSKRKGCGVWRGPFVLRRQNRIDRDGYGVLRPIRTVTNGTSPNPSVDPISEISLTENPVTSTGSNQNTSSGTSSGSNHETSYRNPTTGETISGATMSVIAGTPAAAGFTETVQGHANSDYNYSGSTDESGNSGGNGFGGSSIGSFASAIGSALGSIGSAISSAFGGSSGAGTSSGDSDSSSSSSSSSSSYSSSSSSSSSSDD